ncbi:PqiC family protein [Shewanella sp. GXUN23E]|uniref:PqiC family protein n=1 Tax=Shewanella sp. GXUN23E TaxID=3422498 RepID=UPI003D7D37CB
MKYPASVLLTLLLTACSSAPQPTQYYLLKPQADTVATAYVAGKPLLIMAPVTMDSLLTQGGILYKTSDNEAVVAKQNLWAQSPDSQLTNRIVTGLRASQQHYWPVTNMPELATTQAPTLLVDVQAFNGDYRGEAILSGEWSLIGADGRLLDSHPFSYREPLASEGYSALVDALSTASDKLITDLARKLARGYPSQQ